MGAAAVAFQIGAADDLLEALDALDDAIAASARQEFGRAWQLDSVTQ